MPGPWTANMVMWETLITTNLPGWTKAPNKAFTRPSVGTMQAPAFWQSWDLGRTEVETRSVGRLREVDGVLEFVLWQAGKTGTALIDAALDRLDAFADAVTASSNGRLVVFGVEPGEYGNLDDPEIKASLWYGRQALLRFKQLFTPNAEEVAALAGLSRDSETFTTETDHPFTRLDCVGLGVDGWRKVIASEGEPRCEGIVTLTPTARSFELATAGAVKLPGHGLTVGPVFLSQSVPGALTSTEPTSGVVRRMGTVIDEDWIIVLSLPEQVV